MITPGPAGIERLRRREQHAAVAVGLVLPMDSSTRARMAEPAIVLDVEEGAALAGLLIVRDQAMIGEGRVLERGELDIGAVDRGDARRQVLPGPDGRRRGRTGAVGGKQGRAKRQAHRLRPPEKTTLHGPILNNLLAAPKDLFKAGLQNREDGKPLKASGQRRDSWSDLSIRGAHPARPNARSRNQSHATETARSGSGDLRLRLRLARLGPGQGNDGSQTAAPARQSRRPEAPRQGGLRKGADPGGSSGPLDRLLLAGLSRRRQGAAGRRRVLAGRAPVAQPDVGKPGDDRLPRALLAQGEGRGRLERHSGRRHLPAARRADADRPRLPSGRPRRRRLAHPDARPYAVARGAREHVGGQHGDRGRPLGRQDALDARHRRRSSRLRRRSPKSSASSSTPRSRRPCARPRGASPG